MRAFLLIASLAISTTVGALGCGSAPPAPVPGATEHADHHDVPITEADVQMPANYAEAVVRIKGYRDAIRTAAQGTEPELAHRPLDELDIVLNRLPEIARDHGVPKGQWETGEHLGARTAQSVQPGTRRDRRTSPARLRGGGPTDR